MYAYFIGRAGMLRKGKGRVAAVIALAIAIVVAGAFEAYAQNCKPRRPRPPVKLTSMGPCAFDSEQLSFAGAPVEQALCLLRAFDKSRNIGPALERLPDGIASRVGRASELPSRDALAKLLIERGLAWDLAPFLWTPLSRARDNDPSAPQARYLVIHDTSGPYFGGRPFPTDLDHNRKINNLARFRCADGWEVAHIIVNRSGQMLLGHELSEPWRATKFERATVFGTDLKGLFLHVELIQPRRRAPGRGRRNDAMAPDPGFSGAQYDRLALIYITASVRAGRWLIPAFHGPIDSGIRGGHDDPQNFDLEVFAARIDTLVAWLAEPPEATMSIAYGPVTPAAVIPLPMAAPPARAIAGAEPPAAETGTAGTTRLKRPARKAHRYVRSKPKNRRTARRYRR
jgi:hypothetical protein